jgi:catechol 2,3-dioxygenase-like lactoylglutathione lyase family enzyme
VLIGAHAVLYSADAPADRAFLRDVLGLTGVDAGEGWLIFGLPPAELAVHPAQREAGRHELFFQCADVDAFAQAMRARGISCSAFQDQHWGRLTHVTLPGGGRIGVYEPRHPRPQARPQSVAPRSAGR